MLAPKPLPQSVLTLPDYLGSLSVVVPVKDEADNVLPLVAQVHGALEGRANFELIYVDDRSTDATRERLEEPCLLYPRLRVLRYCECCS